MIYLPPYIYIMCDIYLHCRLSESMLNVKFWNLKKFLFICTKFFIDDIGINCYYWKDSFTCEIEICYLTLVVSLWYSLSDRHCKDVSYYLWPSTQSTQRMKASLRRLEYSTTLQCLFLLESSLQTRSKWFLYTMNIMA